MLCHSRNFFQEEAGSSPNLVPISEDHCLSLPGAQCLETLLFHIFVQFFGHFRWINMVPVLTLLVL